MLNINSSVISGLLHSNHALQIGSDLIIDINPKHT